MNIELELKKAHLTVKYGQLLDERKLLDANILQLEEQLRELGMKLKSSPLAGRKLEPRKCPAKGCEVKNTRLRWGYYCKAHEAQHKANKGKA